MTKDFPVREALELSAYREVYVVDTEFIADPGEQPKPVCLCAKELRRGRKVQLWRDQLDSCPPFSTGSEVLFVAFFASAEIGFFLSQGWPVPERILDLYTEFRNLTNSDPKILTTDGESIGRGLLDALTYFGLESMSAVAKEDNRKLIMTGGPWDRNEQRRILEYCMEDVESTGTLLFRMAPTIEWPYALIRGRYMAAVARMEHCGTPIDVPMLELLRSEWDNIKHTLVRGVDAHFGIYDDLTFKTDRFIQWLARNNLQWPSHPDGTPNLRDRTFKMMEQAVPRIKPLRQLRKTLSKLHLDKLQVGRDGFNRCLLSPFSSKTSRNQPSTSKFIFGAASWVRHLIKPPEGYAVVYLDFSQQEFGIAAALSLDPRMIADYNSGDSYLGFGKRARLLRETATKKTHSAERDLFKAGVLSIQYDTTAPTLALTLGQPLYIADMLLDRHRRLYRQYWRWSDNMVDHARINHFTESRLGWRLRVNMGAKSRTLRNFPIQSAGAEMLRLAVCDCTEAGLLVCAPIHDAILLLTSTDRMETDIRLAQYFMERASRWALKDVLKIRVDHHDFVYPDRFVDNRGVQMWNFVNGLLEPHGARQNTNQRVIAI